LDLAKIEAGQMEILQQPTALRAAMEDAIEILADRARQKGLELTALVSPGCPSWVMTDPGRLRQVLINLIGNAVKFTEHGEVTVRVRRIDRDSGPLLRFTVTDTGVGIPSSARRKLFRPFSQVDASSIRRHQGTGLGLSLSRRLVQAMGGEIGIDSQLGQGTTLWFTLPLLRANRSEEQHLPSRLHGSRALVVDCHAATREQLGQLLLALQLEPILCQDEAEALGFLNSAYEKSLVIALVADGEDGRAAQDFARALHTRSGLANLPILRLSKEADGSKTQNADFAGHLLKPVRLRRLAQPLQDLLGNPSVPNGKDTAREISSLDETPVESPRILLAEDDPANQRLAILMLQRLGCAVDPASNGQQALSAARSYPYDLIFLDFQMPEMDGLTAAAEIRKLPFPQSQVPIVALTANVFEEDRQRSLAVGMNDFLIKPVTLDSLRAALRRFLPKHLSKSTLVASSDRFRQVVLPPTPTPMPTPLAPTLSLESTPASAVAPPALPAPSIHMSSMPPSLPTPALPASLPGSASTPLQPAAATSPPAPLSPSAAARSPSPTSPPVSEPAAAQAELQIDIDAIQARLAEIREVLDPDAASEIAALCKRDWPALAVKSRAELEASSLSLLRETIHRLAGSALQVGAKSLGQKCRSLEALLRSLSSAQDGDARSERDSAPQSDRDAREKLAAGMQAVHAQLAQIHARIDALLQRL
jgi:CheY-like chemotaxis protein/HPt (histidine-containing phosphotransfer) domain-containing protein